jgi:aryl-alcohol dehydrogenase-like predicted oxidoreductase
MQMLEQSLRWLQTDHLDLWQVHGVVFQNAPNCSFAAVAAPKPFPTP